MKEILPFLRHFAVGFVNIIRTRTNELECVGRVLLQLGAVDRMLGFPEMKAPRAYLTEHLGQRSQLV